MRRGTTTLWSPFILRLSCGDCVVEGLELLSRVFHDFDKISVGKKGCSFTPLNLNLTSRSFFLFTHANNYDLM
jgi:hypothetical protein